MSTLPFGVVLLLSLITSAVVAFLTTPLVKKMAYRVGAIDVPKDNRRMHKTPIPRLGGLAIAIGFLLTVLLYVEIDRQLRGILLGAIIIVVLGVLDDCLTLRASVKFIIQILAACVVVGHGCSIQFVTNPVLSSDVLYVDLGHWSVPLTIIWIVAITNAVNFIDGLDFADGYQYHLGGKISAHWEKDENNYKITINIPDDCFGKFIPPKGYILIDENKNTLNSVQLSVGKQNFRIQKI